MTEKQKKALLKSITTAMGEIDAMSDLEYIKGYYMRVIVNYKTLEDIGYHVVIELNNLLKYDEEMLAEWKRMLNADEWYFEIDSVDLYITFKVRYKED